MAEAYKDIQRQKDGKWRWLRRAFYVDTTSGDSTYAYGSATDTVAAELISRFRAWDFDRREPMLCYLVSEGVATQYRLVYEPWPDFAYIYRIGTHSNARPTIVTADDSNVLCLGPTPDGIYRVSGYYWRGAQILSAAADEPEMPADFHMAIVYRAMVKYGYNAVAQELLSRAAAEGAAMWDSLCESQAYSRFSIGLAGALA